ncbi:MAG TPA: hypothetical protein VKA95_08145, partial [Nitrososphaeraceae archaeon]|nr:hypothetical protein [Nitrososphaeraceae archaeon]
MITALFYCFHITKPQIALDIFFRNSIIDVRKCEQNRSLVIVDSVKAYFHSDIDIKSLIKTIAEDAKRMGKK